DRGVLQVGDGHCHDALKALRADWEFVMRDAKAMVEDAVAVPFLDLVSPHAELAEELVDSFRRALRSAAFVGGSEVASFEQEFAAFIGTSGCVGLNSGTDALRFAYQSMNIRPGDEVITVPNTFIATTEALTQAG